MKKTFLELGAEKNAHTQYKERFSDNWKTVGQSTKTVLDETWDFDLVFPEVEGRYELVYASHVLEHVERPVGFLMECRRVLRTGGTLRIVVPDAAWVMRQYLNGDKDLDDMVDQLRSFDLGKHRHPYDLKKLIIQLQEAGFGMPSKQGPLASGVVSMQDKYFSPRPGRSVFAEAVK